MRFLPTCLCSLIVLSASAAASAADAFGTVPNGTFGQAHQLAISAERLFGYVHGTLKTHDGNVEVTQNTDRISLLSNSINGFQDVYSVPRLAVDFFIIDRLSIGVGLGYASVSGGTDTRATNGNASVKVSTDLPSRNAFSFTTRVGYALMFHKLFGVWPRLGLTYVTASTNQPNDSALTENGWAVSAEVMLAITPFEHVQILVGPTMDLGFAGNTKVKTVTPLGTTETTTDRSANEFGIQAGLGFNF